MLDTKTYIRLPKTKDKSLKAYSAADEHIINYINDDDNLKLFNVTIMHDRFGYLTSHLYSHSPIVYTYLASQVDAIKANTQGLENNTSSPLVLPITTTTNHKSKVALIRIPKSMELWRLYLEKAVQRLDTDGIIVASFMTKHFSPSYISIAEEYAEDVNQSKAYKKSRLIILTRLNSIKIVLPDFKSILYLGDTIYQRLGVFSSEHIDYATQFLLQHIRVTNQEQSFLDIGCGNGIIGKYLLEIQSWQKAVLMDDNCLATDSAHKNVANYDNVEVVNDYQLENFDEEAFDLIVTNPPFHFEFEVDPSIATQLFASSHRILTTQGRLIIVANKHLNYKTHLTKLYTHVLILAINQKFIIYECKK